jgi:hypothetical protein
LKAWVKRDHEVGVFFWNSQQIGGFGLFASATLTSPGRPAGWVGDVYLFSAPFFFSC